MNQTSLPIDLPVVSRKCQWGTCDKDYAYCIDGKDLCFEHGQEQIDVAIVRHVSEIATIGPIYYDSQLQLIKP